MKKNVIIEQAFRYKEFSKPKVSEEYYYVEDRGCWVNKNNNMPLVLDPTCQKPPTKKADVETGEDRKGE